MGCDGSARARIIYFVRHGQNHFRFPRSSVRFPHTVLFGIEPTEFNAVQEVEVPCSCTPRECIQMYYRRSGLDTQKYPEGKPLPPQRPSDHGLAHFVSRDCIKTPFTFLEIDRLPGETRLLRRLATDMPSQSPDSSRFPQRALESICGTKNLRRLKS